MHPLLAFLAAMAASLAVHRFDTVSRRFHGFDPVIDGPPAAVSGMGFLGLLALTGRPVFSLILVAGGSILLCVVNRLKKRLFHEPIVFLDASLTMQVIRHPGFYVPYLFPRPVLCCGAVAAVGLGLVWIWEPPADPRWRVAALAGLLAGLVGAGFLARLFTPQKRAPAMKLLRRHAPTLDANQDFARYGLFCSFFLHGLWHVHVRGRDGQPGIPRIETAPAAPATPAAPQSRPHPRPHLVLVQAESFFDVRRHLPDAPASLLAHYDRLTTRGTGGSFEVQTHGAYTMRTEFSVLTGLPLGSLGTDAFNPYFTASRQIVPSLAWRLREQGYRTACIHPFRLSFFRRNRVLPNLGFEELRGEKDFRRAKRCGPFVSDAALAQDVLAWLAARREPCFVFVITMEAHGPWKSGRLGNGGSSGMSPATFAGTPMDIYLHHLRHTDAMFGALADGLTQLPRPSVLCGYGDHVGCLPVGPHGQTTSGHMATQWLLWSSRTGIEGEKRALAPHELGRVAWDALFA